MARERTARALGEPLDQRCIRDAVDDVVESVVRHHPIVREPPAVDSFAWPGTQPLRRVAKGLFRRLELVEIGAAELGRRDLCREGLELCTHEKGLPELVQGDRANTHAAIWNE